MAYILEPPMPEKAFRKNWARLIQKINEVDPHEPGFAESKRKWVCQAGFSLLTTTAGAATNFAVSGGKASFPYFGVAMQPEHNHTHEQPLPLKSEFLSLTCRYLKYHSPTWHEMSRFAHMT